MVRLRGPLPASDDNVHKDQNIDTESVRAAGNPESRDSMRQFEDYSNLAQFQQEISARSKPSHQSIQIEGVD